MYIARPYSKKLPHSISGAKAEAAAEETRSGIAMGKELTVHVLHRVWPQNTKIGKKEKVNLKQL